MSLRRISVSVAIFAVLAGIVTVLVFPRRSTTQVEPPPSPAIDVSAEPGGAWFENVTKNAGIDFVHYDATTNSRYIHETMGSGIGWIDYDADGWPDLFCVQDGPVRPTPGVSPPSQRLYRNNRNGTFQDVTEQAGLVRTGFGQGCAVGDFDNDGFDDLLVTDLRGVRLYRNTGNSTFTDVTEKAGLTNPHWGTSCAWGDFDADGFLDFYLCNYVELDLDRYPKCEKEGLQYICPPTSFPHTRHRLFRNNGNGTFADVTVASGIAAAPPAPGLGVVATDLDGDGKLDLYVANDLKPQYLFHNLGKGQFQEKGVSSGAGLGPSGQFVSGMGVEAFDADGTGRPSLFGTNFHNQPNVLFRNRGKLKFSESAGSLGLAGKRDRLGFGVVMIDANLDTRPDLALANGHLMTNSDQVYRAPYAQRSQLFLGGAESYRDASDRVGPYFRESWVGRGVAWADFDNDGKPDLAFSHVGAPPALLHNRTETKNAWLGLELVGDGKTSNRNAVGSRIEIETTRGVQIRFVNGGGSYLSASERRQLIGLGNEERATRVTVRWPSGQEQTFREVPGRKWYRLIQGHDQPSEMPKK